MKMSPPSSVRPTRRQILSGAAALPMAACGQNAAEPFVSESQLPAGRFDLGVASGDPQARSVILWSHIQPDADGDMAITWEMDRDADFASLSASGTVMTNSARDYTVKVEATGLEPGTWYYYRFRAGETVSPIGRTRTLPEGEVERLRFATVSCANWQHGYFNVYDLIARLAKDSLDENPFDAMIHLGDYFYEYGAPETPRLADRVHEPAHEIISLSDYRMRHAQYRSDPALQAATAAMPLIAVWDDHESANDSWVTGAENHQEGEGSWDARKQAALRAYYEWMPVRQPSAGRAAEEIYRSFEFGDLATLTCVETRLTARTEPLIIENYIDEIDSVEAAEAFKKEKLYAKGRQMFGPAQQDFIVETLSASKDAGKPWRLLANQVIMGRLLTPDFTPYLDTAAIERIEKDWPGIHAFLKLSKYNMPMYPDSWDGYPLAREDFYAALDAAGVNDMLVLTGDAHEFWLNELTSETGTKLGLELVTSSVSSQTMTEYLGDGTAEHNLLLTRENEDARFYNAQTSGFVDLTLTREAATVVMRGVDTVTDRNYAAFETAGFTLKPKDNTLKAGSPKGLSLPQRALFHGMG